MRKEIHFVRLVLIAACFAPLAPAAPGDLDGLFGAAGTVTTPVGSSTDSGYGVAVQADGKIVVVGFSYIGSDSEVCVVRYNADGSLDTTFGGGTGKVITSLGGTGDYGRGVAVQTDGKIVVAGGGGASDFALVRYTSTGALDTTFNGTGKVLTPINSGSDLGQCVGLQTDGKIVMAGSTYNGSNFDFGLARFTTAGALDTTFNGTGKVTTPIGAASDVGESLAIQSDGKIVVAGYASVSGNDDFAVARYTTAGALDGGFNGTGKATTVIGASHDQAHSVAIQSDGKIVVAGASYNGSNLDFAVVRYTTAGALDTAFSGDGKVTTDYFGGSDTGQAVAVQGDGKIIVAGSFGIGGVSYFALVRYNTDGSLDTGFGGGDGIVTTFFSNGFGGGVALGRSITLQSDGKVVVAGDANSDVALARYQSAVEDADGDGLRDTWEIANWGATTGHSALDDYDHDGYEELLEEAFGLDPTLPNPGGLPAVVNEGGYLTMTITKQAGVSYEVQSGSTLLPSQPGSFSPFNATVITNFGATLKVRDNVLIGTPPSRFMRVKVTATP